MKGLNTLILALVLIIGSGGSRPPSASGKKGARLFVSHYENVLGTSLEFKVLAPSQKDASAAELAALNEIARLGKILSGYDSSSEFRRWFTATGAPVNVSKDLYHVLYLFDQ